MNISDEAVEAAVRAVYQGDSNSMPTWHQDIARAMLEAAAPYILAQAENSMKTKKNAIEIAARYVYSHTKAVQPYMRNWEDLDPATQRRLKSEAKRFISKIIE